MEAVSGIDLPLNVTRYGNFSTNSMQYVRSYFFKISAIAKMVTKMKISRVLKPFDHLSEEEWIYRLYIQPVLFIFALATFVVLAVYTRKDRCFKSYVLTVIFLLNDTIGILLPLPFHFTFLPPDPENSGLDFSWCEPYRVIAVFLPQVLYYHSQWLKFAACIFECFSIYNPDRAQWFYRKRFLTTLLVISLLVTTVVTSLMHYDVNFEKFAYLSKKRNALVHTCILIPSAIYDVTSKTYNIVRIVTPVTVGIVVPFLFMTIGSIILITEICPRSKTSNDLKNPKCKVPTSNQQHVKFVAVSSVMFTLILLPRLVFEILVIDEISFEIFLRTWTVKFYIISQILYHVTVPVTVLVYYVLKKGKGFKVPEETTSRRTPAKDQSKECTTNTEF